MPSTLSTARLLACACWLLLVARPAATMNDLPNRPVGNTAQVSAEATDPVATDPAETEDASDPTEPLHLFEELMIVGATEAMSTIPGAAHLLTEQDLERQEYTDIHRVLRQIPGINIQEEEGFGLRPNIGIRGTGVDRSQKITLLEDGVLIAPAPYSAPAAYYSPTAGRMENIEVRKGSSTIRQGPYTTGGALNYVSTRIPGAFSGRLSATAGGDGLRRAHFRLGDSRQRVGWLLETFQLQSEGFKRLDTGGPTGFDLEDYLAKLRFNSRADARFQQVLELKLGKTDQLGHETYLGLTQEDFDRSPFRRYAASDGDRLLAEHEQLQLAYFVGLSERSSLTATVYRNDFFRNWFKLEKVAGTPVSAVLDRPAAFPDLLAVLRGETDSDPGDLAVRNNRRDYHSQGVQLVLEWTGNRHELDFGLRYHEDEEDRFQEEDLFQMLDGRRVLTERGQPGSNANRIAEAEALAFFAEDTISAGRWTFSPGLRIEIIDLMRRDFGRADPDRTGTDLRTRENSLTELIPGLGISYRVDDASVLFLGVHRGFSPPSPSSTREVDAEESVNYELGWRRRDAALTAEIVGFFNDYDNLLGNDTVSGGGDGTGDQFNGGAARVWGLEASLGSDLATRFDSRLSIPVQVAYSLTRSEFRTTFLTTFPDWAPRVDAGDELPYIPRHQLYLGLGFDSESWAINLSTSYTSETRTRAGRGRIPAEALLDARVLLDLRAEYRLRHGLKLWAQLLNATDEVYVAARRPAGLRPGQPRTASVGLSFEFPAL